MTIPAILALEDGNVFYGRALGNLGLATGEVVFNTAMTGYQEILTDPSYAKQMVVLTYPHIGNTGINMLDREGAKIYLQGLIVRDSSAKTSSWRSELSLDEYLKQQCTVAITDIDTRHLTRVLRDKGAQRGCIMSGDIDAAKAVKSAQTTATLLGCDLAKHVSTRQNYEWEDSIVVLNKGASLAKAPAPLFHVVVYDFGVKHNILRLLRSHGCRVTVVPAQTPCDKVLALQPDGVVLSNGPGDPAACDYAIEATQQLLAKRVPLLGICLGFQIMLLAEGAKTFKMKFGHHGANHPVQDIESKRVFITSQNHGFAVSEENLPNGVIITHRSLFDQTLQGVRFDFAPALGFQGHPEASPGPQDIGTLFADFIQLMR